MIKQCVLTALALLALVPGAYTAERKALPAFEVRTIEGSPVPSQALVATETPWLIVYVTSDCPPCDRLVQLLASAQDPLVLSRVAVVVGGESDVAGTYARQLAAGNPGLRVFVDTDGQARQALGPNGLALFAVRAGQLEWSLAGVLNDSKVLEPVINAWLLSPVR